MQTMLQDLEFKNFIEGTTLHGIRYVFQKDHHVSRRIIWVCLLLLATILLATQIIYAVEKYHRREVYTSIQIIQEDSLQLPAITLCNLNTAYNSSVHKFLTDNNFTSDQMKHYNEVVYGIRSIENASIPDKIKNLTFKEYYYQVSPTIDKFMLACTIGLSPLKCSHYVSTFITEKGMCYTFNSYEKIKQNGNTTIYMEGTTYGMSFALNIAPEEYLISFSLGTGVRILVHDPRTLPDIESGSIFVGNGQEAFIAIERHHLKRLSEPYSAPCLSEEERYGKKHFKHYDLPYSQEACKTDCLFHEVYDCEGCDSRSTGNDSCTLLQSTACASRNYAKYYTESISCNCKPLCDAVKYNTQVSYSSFPSKTTPATAKLYNWSITDYDELKQNVAIVWVYFNKMETMLREEHPVLDLSQLMSNFGGLIGLYLGASVITVVEFLDYCVTFAFGIGSKMTNTTPVIQLKPN